ncbi:MAG: hypothetical protein O3C40_03615 [Planctomycetota bacterium]|nr:hypothetical protein [Planctomycetota bacterium]
MQFTRGFSVKRRLVNWSSLAVVLAVTATGMHFYLHPSVARLVRHVDVKLPQPKDFPTSGNVQIFQSPAELRAAFPGATVDPADAVDFEREDLVQIVWEGHIDDHQPRVWTARAGGRRLIFYEDASLWGSTSDCFCRVLREEWFAVPKGVDVTVN